MKDHYRCWAEIDFDALRDNLAWIRQQVGPAVRIMTVVKADAYGHGLKPIAGLLMQSGTDIFGVANLAEARAIRSVGKGWPILLLGPCLPGEIEEAIREGVMPTVSSEAEARLFSMTARRMKQAVNVHLKVDTGMGRLGVAAASAAGLAKRIRKLPGLRLEGIYTHFSAVEDDSEFSRLQRQKFECVLEQLRAERIEIPTIHAANSGGLLHEPESVFNVVRPGLLVYGIVPPGRRKAGETNLGRPALSLHCRVGFVKTVRQGTRLSYGGSFVARKSMRVATLTAGYGDGYFRAASNRAEVLIDGKRCRVLGRVTMDQTLVDVTRVRTVRVGDEAILIGKQKHKEITANELAERCGTIPWEVLTAISYRVPRVYRGSQAA